MIQDIGPSALNISYKDIKPERGDAILSFKEGKLSVKCGNGLEFPGYEDEKDTTYLFAIDEKKYFLCFDDVERKGFERLGIRELRSAAADSKRELFAAFTAFHLWQWYITSAFCGKCGGKTVRDDKERAMVCPVCGNKIYPRINPAVIIGIRNGDRIVITKYRVGYAHSALVAGFAEIGETLEDTVRREVMEEVGLHVKNITYYKSQPWGSASDLLVGFYCDVDGDPEIHMDEGELKYAEWVKREDIVLQPNDLSLTNEMMKRFQEGLS